MSTGENEIVGINNVYGGSPSDSYSGIIRSENSAWGTVVIDDSLMDRLRDLPGAIALLEAAQPVVRKYTLEEYAAWKMENDCYQLPEDLAIFLRVSIAKNEFWLMIDRAIRGY